MVNRLTRIVVLVVIVLISFSYGFISSRYETFPYDLMKNLRLGDLRRFLPHGSRDDRPVGKWGTARMPKADQQISQDERKRLEDLATLPYLEGYHAAPDKKGVSVYDEDLSWNGYNFFVSGHSPKAFLMDMRGNILHEWGISHKEAWPGPLPLYVPEKALAWLRRAHLFENGDIVAIFEGLGMVKLDKDSNLLWARSGRMHHDLYVADNGDIYTLTRRKRDTCEQFPLKASILEDFITILSPEGEEIKSISILEAFLNSEYASTLAFMEREGDCLHTNTIELLDSRDAEKIPVFKAGHVLISINHLNTIAVIDPETEKVTWALSGMWMNQHEPRICPNGNLILFDNRGYKSHSKIIEFNPLTQEVAWTYKADPPEDFYSAEMGTCQRLANGNTLITESNHGRAFEVTPDNQIVWEFINPHRAGKDNELIATLFDVVRIDPDQLSFLDGPG